ncbi:hypothetical protein KP509_37G002600 [Ceratopteris richardii]|uniref:Uncharacterized protein n=1 Tax=Ceratopteris richardii TaxID=49495 RepID=A0A8T2Q6W3_CERRI|nr:hypothetical protein KP509_37G002600 [Ceratopteris richardii]
MDLHIRFQQAHGCECAAISICLMKNYRVKDSIIKGGTLHLDLLR